MDRYNMVKLLLKNWEQEFVKEHHRKPNKEDIDQAPEETRKLYKEYRSLKQAKENCSRTNSTDGKNEQSTSEANPPQKGSDCWGAHLNRSAMPVKSPKLTTQDRDSLKTSAQYYGLKLKANMGTLTKERSMSLKKPGPHGRVSLNSLEDGQSGQAKSLMGTPKITSIKHTKESSKTFSDPFSPRLFDTNLRSSVSQTVLPVEAEEPFEPFKAIESECQDAANVCCTDNSVNSINENAPSAVTQSGLLSSLSASSSVDTLKVDIRVAEGINKDLTGSQDVKVNTETPQKCDVAADIGTLTGVGGGPQFHEGFKVGTGGRPSASRMSFIDKKWLERCQVFGEMGAEEKPGAGNQEFDLKNKRRGIEVEIQENKREGQEEERSKKGDVQKGLENVCDGVQKPAVQGKRKSRGDTKMREMERGLTPEEGVGSNPKPNSVKKRKREGGVKKKEEDSDANSSQCRGGKRRKTKKKGEEEEEEELKEKIEPKKVPQENLFGEIEESFGARKLYDPQLVKGRNMKGAEGNFVKINLKKKSHVKGYALRGMALRKQMYMQKYQLKGERFGGGGGYFGRGRRGGFRGGLSRQGDTCYKCGGTGHWAVDCKGRAPPPVPNEQPANEEPFELPTLEEVARATGTLQQSLASPSIKDEKDEQKEVDDKQKDELLLDVIRPDYERLAPPPPMEPLYDLKDDGKIQATPVEVYAALRNLGYQSFRPGQEEAIMRILSGLSTLVVLSTGMGKSLCYQLPAFLYAQRSKCITLVISPLVSLMDDQLSGLPVRLKAACIHSNMTMKQREAAIAKVKSGEVCVLLLSPEALVGGGGVGSGCLPSAQELPPVAFACIDEAHCVSEWSHNFRPCYLRLCKVLRERLGVQCLLGLTATATMSTALDIARHLDISDEDGIAVRSAAVPPNLNLSVSVDREKDQALVSLLRGDRFGCLDSIIVYCTRRDETVRVAALLRTCLQGVVVKENKQITNSSNPAGQKKKDLARKKIRKPLKWQAESYHAGLSASERRRVQNNFMCGELRMVVATVAFGMGLDKSDVRGIVHYNMPKSFESYVQEIGRAGRDGEPAHCHLFLDPEGEDLHELRRHIYADTVDHYTVKKLVQKVFPPCKCKQIRQKQQELTEDIDDSDLLEMMDVADQENGVNPSDQQDTVPSTNHSQSADRSQPSAAQVISVQEEKKVEQLVQQEAADSLSNHQQEEVIRASDWPEERVCHTHERAVPVQQTVETLDITEEGVETLLCYLELHPRRFVELLHPTMSVCKISCYDGPRQLQKITKICPPIAVVLARKRMAGQRVESCGQLEFDVVEVADTMGWQLPLVKRGLRQLQWSTDRGGGRSGVLVEFSDPSFYFRSYGDLSDEELDRVCQFLHNRVQEQEKTQLFQLTACFKAFKSVAYRSVSSCVNDLEEGRSLELKNLLLEYFEKRRDQNHTYTPVDIEELDKYKLLDWENQIRADIRSFLSYRSDEKFSGRALARIFHGIGSPCFPAQVYGKDRRYWRKYIRFDFNQLIRLATQEIIRFK